MTSGQMSLAVVTGPWCLSLQAASFSVVQPFQVLVAPSTYRWCRSSDQNWLLDRLHYSA